AHNVREMSIQLVKSSGKISYPDQCVEKLDISSQVFQACSGFFTYYQTINKIFIPTVINFIPGNVIQSAPDHPTHHGVHGIAVDTTTLVPTEQPTTFQILKCRHESLLTLETPVLSNHERD